MTGASQAPTPVVEPNPAGEAPNLTMRALSLRVRQQEILVDLGVMALQNPSFAELLDRTAERVAEGLQADYSKVMEYRPEEGRLVVRAGFGWEPGVVGTASVGADLASPAGFALRTGKPVISNHLDNEERFRTPELLVQRGIRRAMNVILQGDGRPFGVLEVDSRSEGEFIEHDFAFLQGAANILGMAIERRRHEASLRKAIERQRLLLKELNHRVMNSLSLVASMLSLEARACAEEGVQRRLKEAASRVHTIARHMRGFTRTATLRRSMSAPTSRRSARTFRPLPATGSWSKRRPGSASRRTGRFPSRSSSSSLSPTL